MYMASYKASVDIVGIVEEFFGTTLEGRPGGMCDMNLGLHLGLVTSKKLWTIIHRVLYVLI